jgi:hypothetical protein
MKKEGDGNTDLFSENIDPEIFSGPSPSLSLPKTQKRMLSAESSRWS